jgi:hypothetical protein
VEEDKAAAASAVVEPAADLDLLLVMLSAKYLGYVHETGHIDRRGCCGPDIIVFSHPVVIFTGPAG